MKDIHNEELLPLMEGCGHFLHHRRGGKRGQGKILKILSLEGEMTQKELQERLGIQAGSMSEIVLKLEAKGFIERKRDEEDKRKIKLTITEAGKVHFEEKRKEHIEQEKNLFDALTLEEKLQLQGLLLKLHKSWEVKFDGKVHRCKKDCKKMRKHEIDKQNKEQRREWDA